MSPVLKSEAIKNKPARSLSSARSATNVYNKFRLYSTPTVGAFTADEYSLLPYKLIGKDYITARNAVLHSAYQPANGVIMNSCSEVETRGTFSFEMIDVSSTRQTVSQSFLANERNWTFRRPRGFWIPRFLYNESPEYSMVSRAPNLRSHLRMSTFPRSERRTPSTGHFNRHRVS